MDKYYCTIVVICNKEKVLKEYTENLNTQKNVIFQLIVIDNTDNQYSGARMAFNSFLAQIEHEIVIFSHPDIRFRSDYALANILRETAKIDDYGVVGIAGCASGQIWKILTNIVHGDKKVEAGERILDITEVQTVDECFFIMKKDMIQKIKFKNKDGWHLYAVEQSLQMKRDGKKNYVIPADVRHLSDGRSLDPSYMKGLEEIIREYKIETEYINTTVKQWKTKGFVAYLYRKYYYIKQVIKKQIYKQRQ